MYKYSPKVMCIPHLSLVVSRNASHIIMHSRQDRNGLFSDINSSEYHGCFRDPWETGCQLLWWQMVQLQVHMVLFRTTTPSKKKTTLEYITGIHKH